MIIKLEEAVAAHQHHGSQRKAAHALGISRRSLRERLEKAAKLGLLGFKPVLPGFEITQVSSGPHGDYVQQKPSPGDKFEVPAGHQVKGVSAYTDAEGRVKGQWTKTREGADVDWDSVFRNGLLPYEGKSIVQDTPLFVEEDFCNFIPCNDFHLNLLTWKREVGKNWDLAIAERSIGDAISSVISRARRAGTAIVLGGGDLLHNDDNTNRTAKSGNVLDCDGRHQKGLEVALRLMIRTIDTAAVHNGRVIVRILKGNHDEYSSVAIMLALAAHYRNQAPRISVDSSPAMDWHYQFGNTMVSAIHGHAAKLSQMPGLMASREKGIWADTTHRYAHGFHVHHQERFTSKEYLGVICEAHRAPIPQDEWHYGQGYVSGASVQVITYHRQFGEYTRTVEPVIVLD